MTTTIENPRKGQRSNDAVSPAVADRPRCVRFLSQNRPGRRMGMGHYERLLLQSLHRATADNRWNFDATFNGRSAGLVLEPSMLGPELRRADFLGYSTSYLGKLPWTVARTIVTLTGTRAGADLYHSLALSFPAPRGRPAIYTIHDLPPAHFPDEGPIPVWARQAVRAAAAIMAPSEFAKRELVQFLDLPEERVHVIPYGCEHDVFHPGVAPASPEALAAQGVTGRFLLYVGGFTIRKNVPAMLDAWAGLSAQFPDLSLVMVGPADQLRPMAQRSNAPRVVVVGYLEHSLLRAFMKAAYALVFPSIYEGFGLPPLEAMALGVPVVAVKAGAIPEVVADAGVLADDGSVESLRAAVRALLEQPALVEQLKTAGPRRAAGFSWQRHAELMLALYARAAET